MIMNGLLEGFLSARGLSRLRSQKTSVCAAVAVALYGSPVLAAAQSVSDTQQTNVTALEEVVVTAERREEHPEAVPYSLSVITPATLERTGVKDIASLASQVPGLSLYDLGAKVSGATTPIIRGLNASASPGAGGIRTLEQSPVGVYIGNSPVDGYFQLEDVARIEVLRGPQGTLYGAGALGGAIRIIPNAPQLNSLSGTVEIGSGTVAHSGGVSYTASGVLNVPLGNTLALRASGKYDYEPGYIETFGILERPGSTVSGIPVLADPANPVTSSGIYESKDDWNYERTFTGRVAVLWRSAEKLSAEMAFTYAHITGDGGPIANSQFVGGPNPLDPRITLPVGSDYRMFSAIDQPYARTSKLTSLDITYDAGFATLSSTSSYFTTDGATVRDGTYSLAATAYIGYYAGSPVNPRFVNPAEFLDSTRVFTQEVRLASDTGAAKAIDYVVGAYFENRRSDGSFYDSNPGSPEYSVAEGCTASYSYGASFPNCLLISGPGDSHFTQVDMQDFQDRSVFGELTWHFTRNGQVTFGGRHFQQRFSDAQSYLAYTFGIFLPPARQSAPASKNTWKINPSYQYARDQYVYAIWSQGFRRGGANAVPTVGVFKESSALLSYTPDSDNNYEVGLKGRFGTGLRYSADLFDVEWDKPQVAGGTPVGNYAVWNGKKARSRGVELSLHDPLAIALNGLSVDISAAYADAVFTEDYSYAANNGAGVIESGRIFGHAGQQLPGSPKFSAAATVNYTISVSPEYALTLSLNNTYRSGMYLSTFPGAYGEASEHVGSLALTNLSASLDHRAWRIAATVTNLTDKRAILQPEVYAFGTFYGLPNYEIINKPREISLRLGYSF